MDVKLIMKRLLVAFAFVIVISFPMNVRAEYTMHILDNADLLTDEEEENLKKDLAPILQYGGVAFVSNEDSYSGDADDLAKQYCYDLFNKESGTVFLIDMYNRRIQIYSTGKMYKTINKLWANAITDNIYTFATNGEYYQCASACYTQMIIKLEGGSVSAPMRYLSNLFLAFGLSISLVYAMAYLHRAKNYGKELKMEAGKRNSKYKDMEDDAINVKGVRAPHIALISKNKTKETKTLHSEGGSGGSGGSGGGGSSGGGGGGGGHSF